WELMVDRLGRMWAYGCEEFANCQKGFLQAVLGCLQISRVSPRLQSVFDRFQVIIGEPVPREISYRFQGSVELEGFEGIRYLTSQLLQGSQKPTIDERELTWLLRKLELVCIRKDEPSNVPKLGQELLSMFEFVPTERY